MNDSIRLGMKTNLSGTIMKIEPIRKREKTEEPEAEVAEADTCLKTRCRSKNNCQCIVEDADVVSHAESPADVSVEAESNAESNISHVYEWICSAGCAVEFH